MKYLKTILLAGFISGSLDAAAAILFYAKSYELHNMGLVFRYIAKGILGKGAYSAGVIYPLIGLILHYLISTIWSIFYFSFLSKSFRSGFLWIKMPVLAALIWIVMNAIVMPIFGFSNAHYDGWSILKSFLILLVCVSAPIVIITEKVK